ncbi:MAG: hypothetical protein J6C18_08275 [Bacteroidaceae bacterium]|nr:hypothetical protein [Bacteroidaceae bacterium]
MFDIPRNLIYKERHSLDDFGVYDRKNTCYSRFLYKELLCRESATGSNDRMEEALSIFNTAYYLVTLFLIDPCPETRVNCYCNAARYKNYYSPLIGDKIIILLYFYLVQMESTGKLTRTIDNFTDLLFEKMSADDRSEAEALVKKTEGVKGQIVYSELFPLREVSDDLLNSVDWKDITKGYNRERVYFLTKNIYESDDKKHRMLQVMLDQMKNYKGLSKEAIEGRRSFITLLWMQTSCGCWNRVVNDEEKLLPFIKEKDDTEFCQYELKDVYKALQIDYDKKVRECEDLRNENYELKQRLADFENKKSKRNDTMNFSKPVGTVVGHADTVIIKSDKHE